MESHEVAIKVQLRTLPLFVGTDNVLEGIEVERIPIVEQGEGQFFLVNHVFSSHYSLP